MNRIRVPKIKALRVNPGRHRGRIGLDPLSPGRHTRQRQGGSLAAPAAPSAAPGGDRAPSAQAPARRRSSGSTAGARAQLAERAKGKPGPRLTALATDSHRGLSDTGKPAPARGNYPTPSGRRRKDTRQLTQDPVTGRVSPESTRSQLAKRRATAGQPTEADVRSRQAGQLQARSSTYDKQGRARGTAQRPAAALRNPAADPAHKRPVEASRRHPELSGADFAGRFFR